MNIGDHEKGNNVVEQHNATEVVIEDKGEGIDVNICDHDKAIDEGVEDKGEGIDLNIGDYFDSFDPFDGCFHEPMFEGDKNGEGVEEDEDDTIVDEANIHPEVEVDMEGMGLNTDLNADIGDATIDMEDFESNTDDSDLEKDRKRALRQLRRDKALTDGSENVPQFYVGKMFGTKEGIKQLIDTHAIMTRKQLVLVKNDKVRIRVVCKGSLPEMNKDGLNLVKADLLSMGSTNIQRET